MTPDELESLFGLGILGGPPQLLVGVHVVLLAELQVPQEFWVHPLHLDPGLRRRLPGGIPVTLSVLIVIGVVLRLGHRASIGDFLERKKED